MRNQCRFIIQDMFKIIAWDISWAWYIHTGQEVWRWSNGASIHQSKVSVEGKLEMKNLFYHFGKIKIVLIFKNFIFGYIYRYYAWCWICTLNYFVHRMKASVFIIGLQYMLLMFALLFWYKFVVSIYCLPMYAN